MSDKFSKVELITGVARRRRFPTEQKVAIVAVVGQTDFGGRFDMKRREFITLLVNPAAWPLAARAQQVKLPTIGLLGGATPSAQAQWTAAFVQRLRELGWVEGQTVLIEYRWVEGRSERSPEIIAEFVGLKVDVIVTHATPNVVAAKQGTSVIPIVFPSAGGPCGQRAGQQSCAPGR